MGPSAVSPNLKGPNADGHGCGPLSTRPSRETRYHVADTHLRFWPAFIEPGIPEIHRGRGDLALRRIERSWTAWRGAAVEPVIRESLRRMDGLPEGTGAVGGYWARSNDPEIDLPGADTSTPLYAVSRAGCEVEGVRHVTPEELMPSGAERGMPQASRNSSTVSQLFGSGSTRGSVW
jgi:hypothetical protein